MKIDVFDTYVTQSNGQVMHFDVLMPRGARLAEAKDHAREWLESIGVETGSVRLNSCQFCHSEDATPELESDLARQGYAILQMAGCPSPIN